MSLATRLNSWRLSRNWVAIGNLGEHVSLRLLETLGYQILGTQDDYLGMVSDVLGEETAAHPEDFIAIDPRGRLLTVNSKATASPRTCRVCRDGDLRKPRVARTQTSTNYSTLRANLVSPLEGDSYAQVVKIDLLNLKGQIFEIESNGRMTRVSDPIDITALADEIVSEYPDHLPPPSTA